MLLKWIFTNLRNIMREMIKKPDVYLKMWKKKACVPRHDEKLLEMRPRVVLKKLNIVKSAFCRKIRTSKWSLSFFCICFWSSLPVIFITRSGNTFQYQVPQFWRILFDSPHISNFLNGRNSCPDRGWYEMRSCRTGIKKFRENNT